MSYDEILASVDMLKSTPIAFEALWDGDTDGWIVTFSAITADSQTHPLGVLSDGGDFRLFRGEVPPWPEAVAAQQLGQKLAKRFDAEFYFPSPDHPEDDCPSWKERSQGYPCRKCGILLLQRDPCPWRGVCYQCHLDEEREEHEAQWTPEQRSGPRCRVCGDPATHELDGGPACAKCFHKYEFYACAQCDSVTMIAKSEDHTDLCSGCEAQKLIDQLTNAQLATIRKALAQGRLSGVKAVREVIGCSLYEAMSIAHMIGSS